MRLGRQKQIDKFGWINVYGFPVMICSIAMSVCYRIDNFRKKNVMHNHQLSKPKIGKRLKKEMGKSNIE